MANLEALEMEEKNRGTITLRDHSVLRGTTGAVLLSIARCELGTSPDKIAANAAVADTTYKSSFTVDEVDIFLSHSWHAPWIQKHLALLFHFNVVPSTIAGLSTASCVCMVWWGVRKNPPDSNLFSYTVFFFSACVTMLNLLFYQNLAVLFRRKQTSIFFDKICIHQADASLKAQGISSIGGIIANSKELLVAWDASYFTRLWCPFEIAAFNFARAAGKVKILPVEIGGVVACMSVAGLLNTIIISVRDAYFCDVRSNCLSTRSSIVFHCCTLLPYCVLAGILVVHAKSLYLLESQVATYSIEESDCFCCRHAHIHPDTRASLPCDREYVYASIENWYGGESRAQALDKFNNLVRNMCRNTISQELGRCGVPYKLVLGVTIWRCLYLVARIFWGHCMSATSTGWNPVGGMVFIIETFFLREPLVLAFVFYISRNFMSFGAHCPTRTQLRNFFIVALNGWLCHTILVEIPGQLSRRNWFASHIVYGCIELGVVFWMYYPFKLNYVERDTHIQLRANSA